MNLFWCLNSYKQATIIIIIIVLNALRVLMLLTWMIFHFNNEVLDLLKCGIFS